MTLGKCQRAASHLFLLLWISHQFLEGGRQPLADVFPPRKHAYTARLLEPTDDIREMLVEWSNNDRTAMVGGFEGIVPSVPDETATDDRYIRPPVDRRENTDLVEDEHLPIIVGGVAL